MTNLTLTIDEDVLRRARDRAKVENKSVDAVIQEFLQSYAAKSAARQAVEDFLELARQSKASSGPEGRTWTREDIYEDRLGRFNAR